MSKYYLFLALFSLGCAKDFDIPNHFPAVIHISNERTFVAYGQGGLIITDISSNQVLAHIFPPRIMKGIDDFDIDGDLLFILDAKAKNYLAVYSIADISSPKLVDGPIAVNGNPFNGISAQSGNLVIAGGTSGLEFFQYVSSGKISGPTLFGRDRGHPDVLLSDDGLTAFVSTDFNDEVEGSTFGVEALALGSSLRIPNLISIKRITEAGFTQGVSTPVGFPIHTAISNDNLLVAHGGGLTIIKLVEKSAFGKSRDFDFGINSIAVAAFSNMAYIVGYSDDEPTLMRIDISDIDNPYVVNSTMLNIGKNIPNSIAISDQSIMITAGEAGILTLDK